MYVKRIVVIVVFAVCAATVLAELKDPKIIGGTTTTISRFKYLVYLKRSGSFACGGSLVSERYVITAAHCVKGYPARSLSIHGGTSYLSRNGVTRRVSRVSIPPRFTTTTMNNDIAILRLKAPMRGKNIKPIPLCSHKLPSGAALRILGWGLTRETATTPSTQVRTAIVRLQSMSSCRRSYGGSGITQSMMCASAPGKDTCSGDSGGPVVHNGQLCGVVSWGIGCARRAYPGVYTNVNQLKGFIRSSMKK